MNPSESEIYPYSVTDLSKMDAIIIAPHPDDESIGCGGSIVRHVRAGSRVKVVFITDGDKGDLEGRFGDNYVSMRRGCAEMAMDILGVRDYEFWGYRDRESGSVIEEITERLNHTIKGFSPSLIYAPSSYEVHPDHRVMSEIGLRVSDEVGISLLFYEVTIALCPNILVDITDEMERKRQAIKSYHTELYYNDYLSKIEGLNRFRTATLPKTITFAEGFILLKKD
ncbi:MAG: hypothetical protein Fur0020_00730 [Thermodesulfovibrionia bacterium]